MSPTLNYLLYDPDPARRAQIRQRLDALPGARCLEQGDDLPGAPPAFLAAVAFVLFSREDLHSRAALRLIRRWADTRETPQLMLLLPQEEAGQVRPLIEAGVNAFVAAQDWPGELLAAVQALGAGGLFISGALAREGFAGARRNEGSVADGYGLTAREREILVMIALGLSNKDVARRLALSVRTVETHRLNIRKKTRANTRRDLVDVASKLGLLLEYGGQHGLAERRAVPGFHES